MIEGTRRWIGMVGVAALAAGAIGCTTKTLVFTTYTNLGLDISAANGSPTKAVFGYKRFEGAIIPVDPSDKTTTEAMSTFAAINVENQWWDGLSVVQVFATGEAADNAAKDPKRFADALKSVVAAKPATPAGTATPCGGTE